MADFVNPTTCDLVGSVSQMPAPWVVCTRENLLAWGAILPRHRKWVTDHVEEMTVGEKATADAAILTAARAAAAAQLDRQEDVLRAFMLTVLDEFNGHATKLNAVLSAVDAATSLGDLKTRVGLIADYPARTAEQLRTAIHNKLGS